MNKNETFNDSDTANNYDGDESLKQANVASLKIFAYLCKTQLAVLLIALVWGYLRKIFWWQQLKFDSSLFLGVGVAAVFIILSCIMYLFRKSLKFTNMEWMIENMYLPIFGHLKIWQLLILSVLSGFCEEVFFRGVIFKEWGIIISCILFGILHTGKKELLFSGIWITLMGAILCLLYSHTNNLSVTITAHFLNNLATFIAIYFIYKKRTTAL